MNKKKLRKIQAILNPEKAVKLELQNLAEDIKAVEAKIPPQKDYSPAIQNLRQEMLSYISELPDFTEIKNLRAEFETKLASLEKENIEPIQTQIQDVVSNDITSDEDLKKELKEKIGNLRTEFLNRLRNLGGGQAAPRIQVNGTTMSTRYADINFKGAMSAADNNTTKQVDITVAGIGGLIPSGTSGSVLFIDSNGNLAQDNANFSYNSSTQVLNTGGINLGGSVFIDSNRNMTLAASATIRFGTVGYVKSTGADGEFEFGNNAANNTLRFQGDHLYLSHTAGANAIVANGSGVFLFANEAQTIGFTLNGGTADVLKIKNRANNADAAITALSYGFTGVSAGLAYNSSFGTEVLASDGGAYFMVRVGAIFYNSAHHTYSNGGVPMWDWALPTATGKISFSRGDGSTGAGFDITTDAVLQIRTYAQTGDAAITALYFQTMTALVTLGGGAAPTLGTIGGSGPTAAAQNSWLKMKDSTGADFWVPVWK